MSRMRSANVSSANGLVIICMPGASRSLLTRGVVRIAGDEQHFQIRSMRAGRVGELAPIEAGQAHVGDQQIDAHIRQRNREPARTIDGL